MEAEPGVLDSPDFLLVVVVVAFSHHSEDDVPFADTVDRTVDRGSHSFLGGRWRSFRSAGHVHWAAENTPLGDSLVYSPVAEVVVGGSLGRTARVHSHCPHHDRRSIGRPADLHRIHSLHILHVAAEGVRSLGREIDRSCRIVVEGDSQYSVGAPEPAGADYSRPDEERGTRELDYRPCCQSIGCRGRV